MDHNTEMLELLRSIEKSNRRKSVTNVVICVFMLVAAVSCIALCVMVSGLMPQINEILGQMETVLVNLEQTSQELAALDLETMITDVDELALYAQESLRMTMDKLDTVDFETLNAAIRDLAQVVEPLARFASMFGK